MDLKQAVEYLLINSYAVLVNKQLVITKKLYDELGIQGEEIRPIELVKETGLTIVKKVVNTGGISDDDRKRVWTQFCTDIEIPHRVQPSGAKPYTVRNFNKPAADKLIQIIYSGTDYKRFVESTKLYYKTIGYPTTLTNYLMNDNWKIEYEEFGKNKGTNVLNEGGNRWED